MSLSFNTLFSIETEALLIGRDNFYEIPYSFTQDLLAINILNIDNYSQLDMGYIVPYSDYGNSLLDYDYIKVYNGNRLLQINKIEATYKLKFKPKYNGRYFIRIDEVINQIDNNISPSDLATTETNILAALDTSFNTLNDSFFLTYNDIQNDLNNKQDKLTNPITGLGAVNQISFFNGTNQISGSNFFTYYSTLNKVFIGGFGTVSISPGFNEVNLGVMGYNSQSYGWYFTRRNSGHYEHRNGAGTYFTWSGGNGDATADPDVNIYRAFTGCLRIGRYTPIQSSERGYGALILGAPSASNVALSINGFAGQSTNLVEMKDYLGNVKASINKDFDFVARTFQPSSLADDIAPINSIYFSSTQAKLVYKDFNGTVNNLY